MVLVSYHRISACYLPQQVTTIARQACSVHTCSTCLHDMCAHVQALGRDIRSVHQRLHVGPSVAADSAPSRTQMPRRSEQQTAGDAAVAATLPPLGGAELPAASPRGTTGACTAAQESDVTRAHEKALNRGLTEGMRTPSPDGGVSLEPQDSHSGTNSVLDEQGIYHVVFDGVDISYDIAANGVALVRTATPWQRPATS